MAARQRQRTSGARSRLDEFALGASDDFELTILAEIARAHGGEHLALWTYGHAWIEGGALCAYTRVGLDLRLLIAVLADAPRPIEVAIDLADEGGAAFRLAAG